MTKEKATSPEKKAALEAIRVEFKGTASRSQAARLLEALSRYSITTFEAMRYLDVYHCPARILQLRKRGHKIVTHWQTVITEAGERHRVGLYALESGASQLDAPR
jgi:Helix-turn-helix domain